MLISCNQTDNAFFLEENNIDLTYVNGVLLYKQKPFNGILEAFYQDKSIKHNTSFLAGKKHGLETIWYKNHAVASKRNYNKGNKTGVHLGFWGDGKPKFKYHFNTHGAYHGKVEEWYKTGTLFKSFNYENGKEVGSQKLWYTSGKIKANYYVVGRERFGLIGLKKCYKVTVGSNEIK